MTMHARCPEQCPGHQSRIASRMPDATPRAMPTAMPEAMHVLNVLYELTERFLQTDEALTKRYARERSPMIPGVSSRLPIQVGTSR